MGNDAVVARHMTVRYEDFTALVDATLTVHYGESLGIVGPNGSGKSTLLKTIAGLLLPAGGELRVLGMPPRGLRPGTIAYVPQVEAVDWSFPATVWDFVAMGRFARLRFWQPLGALDRAKSLGAKTILLTCNPARVRAKRFNLEIDLAPGSSIVHQMRVRFTTSGKIVLTFTVQFRKNLIAKIPDWS